MNANQSQNHPADQKIECPGCHIVFARGGNYIAHLEQDRCEGISKREFQSNIQQKHVTKQIMQNPGEYNEIIDTNMALQSVPDKPGLIVDQDSEEGGVAILDRDDEDQKGGYKPLQASVNIMDQQLPLTRSNLETWPRLPGQPPSQLTESMRSMSIKSPTPSMSGTEISASEFASDITSRRGGNKVYTESYPSLGSLVKVASVEDNDDTASEATTTAASPNDYTAAWATGNTSNTLFKDVKPTPPAGDWKSILKHREEQAAVGDRTNLFHSRPWDPNSDDFNIEIFHNPVIEKYCCAFPGCGDTYDEAADLIGHLENAHLKTSFRCPLCLKIFKSAHALVSHSESMGKCKVKNSSMYDRLLDEISGGFLTADHFRQKAVYKPKLDERGMPVEGVMSTRFEAQDARVG